MQRILPERRAKRLLEQLGHVWEVQTLDVHLVASGHAELTTLTVVDGEQEGDATSEQPAGGETQRISRRPIEPLRIVDDTHNTGSGSAAAARRLSSPAPTTNGSRSRGGSNPKATRAPRPGTWERRRDGS